MSCSEKNPTKSVETAQLSGYVHQALNGFSNRIQNAVITIGDNRAVSDSIGRYTLEVPLGEHIIQISHEQFDTITDTINIRGDRSYLINLLNGPSFSVSGIVTDTLGAVADGAIVQLEHLRDTTDINGAYIFQNVLSGQRSLFCDFSDYFIFTDSFEITNDDIVKNINLMRQGYHVSGIVSHPIDGLLSGIEVILDDSLFDTTNINGEYLFESIYIGEHQLQINSSVYYNDIFQFSLGKSDLYKELIVGKSTIQKIFIEQDAMVKITYSSDEGEKYKFDNHGTDQILTIFSSKYEYLQYDSLGQYRVTSYSYHSIFMKLDSTVNLPNDSIILVLPFFKENYLRYGDIRISSVAEDWDEMTITWDNQPVINSENIEIEMSNEFFPELIINITSLQSIFLNPHGFRISFVDGSCYFCDQGLSFYSSENSDIKKRPYILLYKTE